MRRVRDHELAEARHDGRDEQARPRHRDPQVRERAAYAARQQRARRRRQERCEQQRPSQAGEIVQSARALELEGERIEREDRHAEAGRDPLGHPGRDPAERLVDRALPDRERDGERALPVHERAVPVGDHPGEHPPERGGVRELRDHRDEQGAHGERVWDHAGGERADHAIGEHGAEVGVVERGRGAGRELLRVGQRRAGVPAHRRRGEEQRRGHRRRYGGPAAVPAEGPDHAGADSGISP